MRYTGKSPEGKLVYMLDTTPTCVVVREGNKYTLVRGKFGISEVAYVRVSNDFQGFLYYLDKYIKEGAENIVDFVGTADELLERERDDEHVREAVEYLRAAD